MENQAHYDYVERPKMIDPKAFWDQVRRTVNGKPVSEEQIAMIRESIRHSLSFSPEDRLLDLCCGNGALAAPFFDEVVEYLGVDISPVLIEVGCQNFSREKTHLFMCKSITEYLEQENNPQRFTKALCYGAFSYLSKQEAVNSLHILRQRFKNLKALFIGAVPDKDKASMFFEDKEALPLDDSNTAIGRWYLKQELVNLAQRGGWRTWVTDFPKTFYQSHYRFNITLTPVK